MSIIIRPDPGAFRRTQPLVVVFGAFRPMDDPHPLDDIDSETIREGVGKARALRMPLAFSREVTSGSGPGRGTWLPDCRPKITDRVFDHAPGSLLDNREFLSVFTTITDREIFGFGPRNDSSFAATLIACGTTGRRMRAVMPPHPLQKCSTLGSFRPNVFLGAANFDPSRDICLFEWQKSVCSVEYTASATASG